MKPSVFLGCAIALIAIAGFGSKQGDAATHPAARVAAVEPPKGANWTQVVRPTPAGGFVMGNPNARVKLVEYGSMTCPHCMRFDEAAFPQILGYVKTGQVSFEFRNYVRDALDVAASLVARCEGPKAFFPLTRAIYKEQANWEAKVEKLPPDQFQSMQDLPPNQQFLALGKAAGFQQFAAAHGIPAAKSAQCLSNQKSIDQLVQMASNANKQYPDFVGTPTFLINGSMVKLGRVTEDEVWPTLKSKLDAALGRRA
jgi:protein-disulfide isomerase